MSHDFLEICQSVLIVALFVWNCAMTAHTLKVGEVLRDLLRHLDNKTRGER